MVFLFSGGLVVQGKTINGEKMSSRAEEIETDNE